MVETHQARKPASSAPVASRRDVSGYINQRESPSAIMRSQSSQFWRTTIDLDLDLNFSIPGADTANSHVSDQSKPGVEMPSRDRINAGIQPSPVPEGRKEPLCVYQDSRGNESTCLVNWVSTHRLPIDCFDVKPLVHASLIDFGGTELGRHGLPVQEI